MRCRRLVEAVEEVMVEEAAMVVEEEVMVVWAAVMEVEATATPEVATADPAAAVMVAGRLAPLLHTPLGMKQPGERHRCHM